MLATLKRWFSGQNAAATDAEADGGGLGGAINLRVEPDGWADCAPQGESRWVNRLGKVVGKQVIALEDQQALVSAVNTAAENPAWPGVPVYEGHKSDGPAMGWIRQARINAQNAMLQVLPVWNDMGQKLRGNQAYRWFSGDWDGVLDAAGNFRPRVFGHVALTNRPNQAGLGAICSAPEPDEAGKGHCPSPAPSPDGDLAVGSAANAATPAAKSPTEGSGESTTPRPPEALNADTGWLETFIGRLREMIGNAATETEAMQILRQKWDVLYQAQRQIDSLQTLVQGVGNTLGLAPNNTPVAVDCGGKISAEMLLAAVAATKSAANRAPELEEKLAASNARFSEFVVDQAIARNRVAADKRPCALQIASHNVAAAINCWFGGPKGGRAAVNVAPPSNPLAGVSLPGGLPNLAAQNAAPAPSAEAVRGAVNAHLELHPGCDYQTAFNTVYPELVKQGGAAGAVNRKE